MQDIHKGVWQMGLAMLISGSIGAFVLLSGLPVTDDVFWRCAIGAVTLFAFIRFSKKPFSALTRATLALAVIGGVALVVNWLLLFAAYTRISIGLSTVVYNTQPFMLVMMGILLGERVSLVKWGWLLLAFAGVVILLSSELAGGHSAEWLTGIGLALGAAFFYALTAMITRKLSSLRPQHIAFIQVLVGVVILLPMAQMPTLSGEFPWTILLTLGGCSYRNHVPVALQRHSETAYAHYRLTVVHLPGGGNPGLYRGVRPCAERGAAGRRRADPVCGGR